MLFAVVKGSRVSYKELKKYIGYGLNTFYGWHISDLKIYEKPKALRGFLKGCNDMTDPMFGSYCKDCDNRCSLTRPPQSWCYVEEL